MTIRPVAAELFHADRRTDGQTWRSKQSLFAMWRTRLKMVKVLWRNYSWTWRQ